MCCIYFPPYLSQLARDLSITTSILQIKDPTQGGQVTYQQSQGYLAPKSEETPTSREAHLLMARLMRGKQIL